MRFALRVLAAAVAVTTAVGCTGGPPPEAANSQGLPHPQAMVAIGDSITRAAGACGRRGDCVEMSWATGTVEGLHSHRERLRIEASENAHNLAVSGARVAALASQADAAVEQRADYVTVFIGTNDACGPDEAAMTSVAAYTQSFSRSLETLVRGLPDARILVLSVPDLFRLWEVGRAEPQVQRAWESSGVCRTMLGNATDMSAAAQARRARVRNRIQAYNATMAAVCHRYSDQCRYDQNAVFGHRFGLADLSAVDYWHPSQRGQTALAEIAWRAGFWS